MAIAIPLNQLTVFARCNLPNPSCDFASGAAFLVDKPKGWSSFEVVKLMRKCLNIRKIGHAGTLDPMATGLLVVCCGKGTKTISQVQDQRKEYVGEVTFGGNTASLDAETEVEETAPYKQIKVADIKAVLNEQFMGQITQVPPMYSALKHNGVPLYKMARKGKSVKRKPRQVIIYDHEIISYKRPRLKLRITCSKGTYIRTIADDLGRALGSLAYLTGLERTAIGSFTNADALTVDELKSIFLTNG